jgi:hypothetical protein
MHHKTLFHLLIAAILVLCMLPVAVSAQDAGVDAETALEQARALAAEQSPAILPTTLAVPSGAVDPLFIGVDDSAVPAYTVNTATNAFTPHALGVQVWGSAYDAVNDIVYINNGSTLYAWPVGGAIATLGTITDPAGATQAMTGLAFYNGTLYGVKNIANEAVYTIDTTTRVATVYIDYVDADYDFGGLAADPNTGTLYGTSDDTTPFGSGLFRINPDATATQITPYPTGQTDIDGLAVSHDGFAYLVTDEPGFIYVWDFGAAAYVTPLNNPWTSSEVFSAGAWISPASGGDPNIDVAPLSLSSTQPTNTTTQQPLDVSNTGASDLIWEIAEEPAVRPAPAAGPSSASKLGGPTAVQRSAKELQDMQASATADVVQDGSFEAGTPNPFWNESSTNFGTPLCDVPGCGTGTGTGPLTGAWWAWFGGIAAYESGNVSQSVTIPSGGPATLSFWVEQAVCSGDAADYLDVLIDGATLWSTNGAAAECGTLGYRQVTVDVSAYADGGAHLLEFNSEVFGSANTNFFVDDVMLDAQGGGGGAACSSPSDVPWLSVSPTSGTTAPAATTPVAVTFDSTGLAAGVYNANLCVTSNDPDAGPGNETDLVIVPVTLTVTLPPRCPVGSNEVTLLNEGFEGSFPPAGWTVSNTTSGCGGVPGWTNTDPGGNTNLTGGSGLFASADSDQCGSGVSMNAQMWSSVLDMTGLTDPQISFAYDYNDLGSSDSGALDISTDGGATWANEFTWTVDDRGPRTYSDAIAGAGENDVVVRWHYVAGWDWWWQVDEVVVTACEPAAGGDPNIFVDPLSMSSTQATNVQVQQTLTISNTGGGTLNWDIDEEDTTLPVIDAPAILTPQPAAEVMGAPEGAAPEAAQSQPALWRGPAALLYDNGPQVTHPGGGAGGADASAVQTGLGNSTYGFGHAVSSGFRMADDFTVPAGGWNVDTITFFAYQTGSTTASTINAVNVRIWDGPPNAGGSVVWGDTTTNRLASSAWSNIYRVLDTALTNNQRPVMADVATIGTFLPAGTYWVDWQTGGTLTSGPWAHPVTILGQTAKPGSNGLQYNPTTSTWGPAIDTGAAAQQDLPFIVEGTAGGSVDPCTALADIPWLTLSPASGANAGGTATGVTVTFDSTGLPVGTYTGNLCVTSDDPDAGPGNETDLVIVPVELIVTDPTAVTLDGLSAAQAPLPLAGLPLAALPAAVSLALGAAYVLRRKE